MSTPLPSAYSRPLRLLLWAITIVLAQVPILLLAAWLTGCGGGGRKSPRPAPETAIPVTVPGGTVVLYSSCPTVDIEAVRSGLTEAWGRAVSENPRVAEEGWRAFHLRFLPGERDHRDPRKPGGRYLKDSQEARIGCGGEGAASHEPGHHFAHILDLPCAGPEIWHDGGFNLRCIRLPK